VWSALLGALCLAAFLAVVSRAPGSTWKAKLATASRAILADPLAAASLGLCATLATSPLVWGHYLTVFAIPIAWYALWDRELRGTARAWIGGALFLCTALLYLGLVDLVLSVFEIVDSDGTVRSITAFAWIPLFGALLLWLQARLAADPSAGAPLSALAPSSAATRA
jgi:hypothetical protein